MFVVPPDFTDQSSSKANCSVPTALPQLPPPFVIRAIAYLLMQAWLSKCLSSLTCKHVILAIRLTTLQTKIAAIPHRNICHQSVSFQSTEISSILLSFNAGITAAATRISFTWRLTNPFHREFHTVFHHRQLSVISFRMYSLCSSTFCFNFYWIKD